MTCTRETVFESFFYGKDDRHSHTQYVSVVHVLWECSTYTTYRDKMSYVLGSENWEDNFDTLLHLVIVAVWEVRKQKLYCMHACNDSYQGQLQRQPSAGDRGPVVGVGVWLVSRISLVSDMVRVRGPCCVCCCKLCF